MDYFQLCEIMMVEYLSGTHSQGLSLKGNKTNRRSARHWVLDVHLINCREQEVTGRKHNMFSHPVIESEIPLSL